MIVLKAVTIIIAGLLSVLAVRHLMQQAEAVKVRVRTKYRADPRGMTRLRQDPRTGIYYPEN